MASRLAPTAFPTEHVHSLPSIHDLVKNIQPVPKKEDAESKTDEDTQDFILVEVDESSPATPVAEVSGMSLDEQKVTESTEPRTSPFVDMVIKEARSQREQAALGHTENTALTYTTSLNPLLDLFYSIKEKSLSSTIRSHLSSAWHLSPLKALKLVFFLRDIREGKGCNEEFYAAAQWMYESHPETFKYNVVQFCSRFGYWKDLLELLVREHLGEEGVEKERKVALENKRIFDPAQRAKRKSIQIGMAQGYKNKRARHGLSARQARLDSDWDTDRDTDTEEPKGVRSLRAKKLRSQTRRAEYAKMTSEEAAKARAEFAMEVEQQQKDVQKQVRSVRLDKRDDSITKCRVQWSERKQWQDLHLAIAKQFALALYLDKQRLDQGKRVSSLCAKWAPTPDHYHDKHTCIATTIALILFPAAIHRKEEESDEDYVVRALKMYQARYLSPLRQAGKVVETLISARKYQDINYSHVPSLSFKRNKSTFEAHDKDRFTQHVRDAASGKKGVKVNASTLKPHQIIQQLLPNLDYYLPRDREELSELDAQVIEAQWLDYIETIKKSGSLDNCIAIADVSGSMYSGGYSTRPCSETACPIEVCIALSLLVAEVAQPPFNQTLITFSANPQFIHLPPTATTLVSKVDIVRTMDWGMNTNFQAVFDLILQEAISSNLPPQEMIKTIFVFSDMQFDAATSSPLETDYQQIVRKFTKSGYEVPKMIFWNLSQYGKENATPVLYDTIGTALVSGWSGMMLKLFMEKGGEMLNAPEFSPEFVMEKAIGKEAYDVLKIVD